jgi:IS4 transposase
MILPANVVADLYRRRWRIEEAFSVVKRIRKKPKVPHQPLTNLAGA